MNKLYVGNLPYDTTADDLKSLFSPFGEIVDVKLISDFATGRSKGFGFVELSDNSSATKAVSELNGKDYQGRPLRVSEAREKQKRGGERGGNRGEGGGRHWEGLTLVNFFYSSPVGEEFFMLFAYILNLSQFS